MLLSDSETTGIRFGLRRDIPSPFRQAHHTTILSHAWPVGASRYGSFPAVTRRIPSQTSMFLSLMDARARKSAAASSRASNSNGGPEVRPSISSRYARYVRKTEPVSDKVSVVILLSLGNRD